MITYAPTTMEPKDGGKNWAMPPSTMITPTAMLMIRLHWISCCYSPVWLSTLSDLGVSYKMLERSILVVEVIPL